MTTAEVDKKTEEQEKAKPLAGELLYFGSTSWETMGRRGSLTGNLLSPTRLRQLVGIDIRFVASGTASCHCVAVDTQGRCYTWGRNEKGQLGHGDTLQRNLPTVVSQLSKYKIVKAGSGRSHVVVVTDDNKSFSFGWNKHGQLGSGSLKNEIEASPVPCLLSQATDVFCGADLTVWISSMEGSTILTAGLPQYGQLGHGTDAEYNSKEGSVKLVYQPQPRPRAIASFLEKSIVKVACGTNHTVAVDSNGFVYTWGFGGYGRLGHREQKDEWAPRLVEVFQRRNILPPNAVVSAGSANSACTAAVEWVTLNSGGGQLYMWGKLKYTGDDWMYPKLVMDLIGWNIRCMDSGNMHHVVGADDSCISWGLVQYGELGYGPLGQKFSAKAMKVDILNGMHVISVACGTGLSMVVVDTENLDVNDSEASVVGDVNNGDTTTVMNSSRKKGSGNPTASSKKRKIVESESEEEDYGSDSNEHYNGNGTKPGAKKASSGSSCRGRGRGRGRGRPKSAETKTKTTGRGRGRPKSTHGNKGLRPK